MSAKSIELKEYKDNKGEKIYPVAGFSKAIYLVGRILLIGSIGLYALSWITRFLQFLVNSLVDFLVFLNDVNGADDYGIKESLKEVFNMFFPNYLSYSFTVQNFFSKLHLVTISIMVLEAGVIFIVAYGITLMFRHHYGEQAPFLNDRESRRLRKEALRGLDVGYDANKVVDDVENNKKRKKRTTQLEQDVLSTLKQMKVEIHTRRDLELNEDIKEYIIKIPQPKGKKVRETVLRLISDLGSILTRATQGTAKFGEMENEVSGRYFIFRSSLRVEKNESKKMRKSKETQIKNDVPEIESEFSFPLTLFTDNSANIADATARAKKYGDEQKQSLLLYFSTSDIPADLKETNVGNNSVEYLFSIARGKKLTLSTLAEDLENFLYVDGILVQLNAGFLQITVPLRTEDRIPIDVPSMMRKIF